MGAQSRGEGGASAGTARDAEGVRGHPGTLASGTRSKPRLEGGRGHPESGRSPAKPEPPAASLGSTGSTRLGPTQSPASNYYTVKIKIGECFLIEKLQLSFSN